MKRNLLSSLAIFALTLPFSLQGQVYIEVLLSEDAGVSGAGAAEVSGFQLPRPNRQGEFFTKANFLDQSQDIATAGTVLLKVTGSNSAQVLLRDDLAGLDRLTYEPYFPTDDGSIFFQGKYLAEEAQTGSVFAFSDGAVTRLKANAGLDAASFNGTAIIRNLENLSYANLAKLNPNGTEQTFPLFGGEVPGIDGATFKGFEQIAYNPSGKLFFAAQMEGEGIDFLNDHALFTEDGAGNLEIIIREGDNYPATPRLPADGTFRNLSENTNLSCNDLGMLAFRATVDAPDARPSGTAGSIWRQVPGEAPELIAVDRTSLVTANAGELSLGYLSAGSGTHNMVPLLDSAGNVYFSAEVNYEEYPYGDIAFFKWDGTDVYLIGYLRSMLPLPEGIDDPQIQIYGLALSASGRIALYVTIKDGSQSLAAALYAQDDEGVFTEVLTHNVSELSFERENLVASGTDYGPAGVIYPPQINAVFTATEDGPKHPWWTYDDRLLFTASAFIDGETKSFHCLATIGEPQVPASGNRYTWDGGVETTSWQTVDGGKTNWVDSIGARWNLPPNRANAAVDIPVLETVILDSGNVQVGSLDSRGTLELAAPLVIRGDAVLSHTNIHEGGSLTVEGNATFTADVTATKANALIVDAPSGSVQITSTISSPHLISSVASTILASAPEDIIVNVIGEITTTEGPAQGSTANIEANSESASVSLTTKGTFDAIGHTGSMLNLYASSGGDITATLEGAYTASGTNLNLASSGGNVEVDTTNAYLTGEAGAIIADAAAGTVSIESGEIAASGFDAIHAEATGEVSIKALGPIDLIDGHFAIFAKSTESSVDIQSRAAISTTGQTRPGTGIEAEAQTDVTVKQTAPINSDFIAIVADSAAGTIDIDTASTYLSGEKGGILATAAGGSILIRNGEIAAGNFPAIQAVAEQSVSIESKGDLTAIGNQANGIYAASESAGVSIVHDGDISATGTNASGILASSPTTLTVQIISGNISGWTTPNAGVILANAQTASLTNYGDISAASEIGIQSTSTDTTIENHGRIYGDITLESGSNSVTNSSRAYLYPVSELKLETGNTLINQGAIILSEELDDLHSIALSGGFEQTSSGKLFLQVAPSIGSDQLTVSENTALAGTLVVKVIEAIESEFEVTFLQAAAISGTFENVVLANAESLSAEAAINHAKQHPSRTVQVATSYSENSVTLTLAPLILDSYEAWSDHFISGTASANEDTFPFANDDREADLDSDGLSNFAEYVLGTHPLYATESPFTATVSTSISGQQVLTISFFVANQLNDANWNLQTSDNLQAWQNLDTEPDRITDTGELSQYEYDLPNLPNFQALRLRIVPARN